MSVRTSIIDAQRGGRKYSVDYPEATSSSSSGEPASASSERSDYVYDPSQFTYDSADLLKPGLQRQLLMVAQARRKMLLEKDSDWANSKHWGWTVAEDFDGTPYLKPAKESEVPEGQGWWHSVQEYLNAVSSWAGEGSAIHQDIMDDIIYSMANTALVKNLTPIGLDYGYTGSPADREALFRHRAKMQKELAKYDPAVIARENELRQQARNAYNDEDARDLFKFSRQGQTEALLKNMVIPGLNAVMADPELWRKTSTIEKVARGGTDVLLDATAVVAPELIATQLGARSAMLGARPALAYAMGGGLAPIVSEGAERFRDLGADFLTGYGTTQRPLDPADLGINMGLGAITGGLAGKVAPRAKADYRFVQKQKNLEDEIAAANRTNNPEATLQDLVADQTRRVEVTAQQQADRIAQLNDEIAELKAKDATNIQPEINAELKRLMWERGDRTKLESEAAKAGKAAKAEDFISDKDLGDIQMPQEDFVRAPFREYDAQFPNSALEVPMFPEPGARHPRLDDQWFPLATTEGMPNQKITGATLGDVKAAAQAQKTRGYHLGKEFDDPDLSPVVTADPRNNMVGFRFEDQVIPAADGNSVKIPRYKNGRNYAYLGWEKPTPDFIERFAKELGVDLSQYPKEFVDKELPVLVQKYLAGDPATRSWVGSGLKIMNEAERRAELQAFKGKQMQSGVKGMATDASDKNMGLANWIEHEGRLGTVGSDGVFTPATPEQVAAREQASRGYSSRKAMYKPDQQKVDEVTASVRKKHDDAMAKMETQKRGAVEKQNERENVDLANEKKILNNLELRQEQLLQEGQGKGVLRGAAKWLGYGANAVGQSAPLSQLPPFDWFIDFVPNKTMKPNPDNASENRQRAWELGLEQPEKGDEYYNAYLRWKRRQEQKNR